MIFNFKKKMKCGKTCAQDFEKQIIKLVPSAIGSVNFHVTILHSQPFHKIELVFYDSGKHESMEGNQIKSQNFTHPAQKKFKGDLPSLSELEDL